MVPIPKRLTALNVEGLLKDFLAKGYFTAPVT
jgi:hypothetical protein